MTEFLPRERARGPDYRLREEPWAWEGARIAYERHDDSGNWLRSDGSEKWGSSTSNGSCGGVMRRSTIC